MTPLIHTHTFDWLGGTYYLYQDISDHCFYSHVIRLDREYPEGIRYWWGYGQTWIECLINALVGAAEDKAVQRKDLK